MFPDADFSSDFSLNFSPDFSLGFRAHIRWDAQRHPRRVSRAFHAQSPGIRAGAAVALASPQQSTDAPPRPQAAAEAARQKNARGNPPRAVALPLVQMKLNIFQPAILLAIAV